LEGGFIWDHRIEIAVADCACACGVASGGWLIDRSAKGRVVDVRVRSVWEETPRAGCAVLWTTGVVLLALGWWGDHEGFRTDKAFVTNVFSSVTAAAFGSPLALVVLNRIGMAQAETVEARAGRRLAVRVAGDFAASAPQLVPGPAAGLDEAAAGLFSLERAAQEAIRNR